MQNILLFWGMTSSLLFSVATNLWASDFAKESRWREQIVDSLLVGEVIDLKLKSSKENILALYTPATGKREGGIIVLHGTGAHPNWPDVIYPLRTELPEYGWSSLSVQLPVLANDAKHADYLPLFDEVAERINAGTQFLKSKGVNNIIIIGHSMGAAMASYYLSTQPKTDIRAFIGIGMSSSKADPKMDTPSTLAKIKIPVLDLFGSRDLDSVLASVKQRNNAGIKAKNNFYFQKKITGANHFMQDKEAEMIKRIRGWLKRYAAGIEIPLQ